MIMKQHITEYSKDPKKPNQKTRIIGNFLNYKDANGNWNACSPAVDDKPTAPSGWQGTYEFDHASMHSNAQFFARDANDVGNRALFGIRLSDQPGKWINFKAALIDNASDMEVVNSRTVKWSNLWNDTDFVVHHTNHGVKTKYIIKGANHPTSYTETVKLGEKLSLRDNGDNSISVIHTELIPTYAEYTETGEGIGDVIYEERVEEKFKIPAPFGYLESDPINIIRCTMAIGAKINGYDSIVITPNADDLASVGYSENIVIDPTVTVSGIAGLEDNQTRSSNTGLNYGGWNSFFGCGKISTETRTNLFRILNPSINIPAGILTAARFKGTRASHASSQNSDTVYLYPIKDANTWVEGTASGAAQGGSSCWLYAKYTTQSWAGSAGCNTIGTTNDPTEASVDYDLTPSGSLDYDAYTAGADVDFTLTLSNLDSLTAWRDGTRTNNGWVGLTNNVTDGWIVWGNPTEGASSNWYIEIDYKDSENPFPTDFKYQTKITVDNTKVAANQTDFAVLLTEADLPSAMLDADGATPAKNGGGDLRASADAAGATRLPLEIVTFTTDNNPANGKAEVWVKVPSLSSSVDTDFYLWWGDSTAVQPAENDTYGKENVWNSKFKMVQHLSQDPSGTAPQIIDSTGNDNDGTTSGTLALTDAQIGKGLDFTGSGNGNVYIPASSSLYDYTNKITFSCWATPGTATNRVVASRWDGTVNHWVVVNNGTTYSMNVAAPTLKTASASIISGLHHIVGVADGSNVKIYVDGTETVGDSYTGNIANNTTEEVWLGCYGNRAQDFTGTEDEVRFLNDALTANDVTTHYNNENGTFVSNNGVTILGNNAIFFGCNF